MLIKKCSRHEVQDIRPWSKWQLHATLRSWISKQIPIYSYFSKTSPSTPSFAYFSLATAWHNVAAKYAKGRLNRGREAWNLSSLPCSEVATSQGPSITISMELFPLLCAMHCWYNFQIDLSKDSNLFWNYCGLCHFSTDLCSCLQVHAIKKPAKWKGCLKATRFSLGQVSEHSAAGGRWGAIAVLQVPWLPFSFPIENGQAWLFCFSLCPPPVLF